MRGGCGVGTRSCCSIPSGPGSELRSSNGLPAPRGPSHRERIHTAPGERWFAEDRPIREVHADASMFVGGLSALLLQSLHPLAMAGVAAHSGYKGDPWGRLQRTSYFLAVTTFGTAAGRPGAVARVRGIHRRVTGIAPDGRPYAASDPHLLEWVHVTEAWSFLAAHSRYGAHPLDQDARDGYVADLARVGAALGRARPADDRGRAARPDHVLPPGDERRRRRRATPRSSCCCGRRCRCRVRLPYAALSGAAVSLLPGWARRQLRLPRLPVAEATVVRPAGHVLVRGIRWAMTPQDAAAA